MQTESTEGVENPERILPEKTALFEFVPVDRYADSEEGTEPLKDTGEPVDLKGHW